MNKLKEFKACRKCRETKEIIAFPKIKNYRRNICKTCTNKRQSELYILSAEHRRSYTKTYYYKNKDIILGQQHQSYLKNKDKELARQQKYVRQPEIYVRTLYYNIGKRLKGSKTYKNRKLTFTLDEFLNFIKNSNFTKVYSDWINKDYKNAYSPSVDRINNKGDYTLDNIQIITVSENAKKRWIDEKLT